MKKEIEKKLNKFLETFEHREDVVGVLACGSFVTGHPNNHSDLDVHLIINKKCKYRERGNRVVDGLLIEYFANTKRQNLAYFKDDFERLRTMSQVQFATGEILMDKTGEVQALKKEACRQLEKGFAGKDTSLSPLELYSIWDGLDDLQAILEERRADFDFIYYFKLDRLLSCLFKDMKMPYNTKSVYGQLVSSVTRKKYLLDEIKDKKLADMIKTAISEPEKEKRMEAFTWLSEMLLKKYNFDISKFSFKSDEEV